MERTEADGKRDTWAQVLQLLADAALIRLKMGSPVLEGTTCFLHEELDLSPLVWSVLEK